MRPVARVEPVVPAAPLPRNGQRNHAPEAATRAERITALRRAVARMDNVPLGPSPAGLCLGLPELERHLPGAGLLGGALHEVVEATPQDRAAALGFIVALMVRAQITRGGPLVLAAARRSFTACGVPYGHGLARMGLDVGRLLLVAARAEGGTDTDTLWAVEETLRAGIAGTTVAGVAEGPLDLTMSRRLNLAAATAGTPLLLLRPASVTGTSAAATRWRIAAAPAGRDRFGSFAFCRWAVALERCRNGRAGRWIIEWDHVAHRFRMAEVMARRAPAEGAGEAGFQHAS